jgi:hypothetical protein
VNNYVTNNVAANLFASQPNVAYAYNFMALSLGTVKQPAFQGADVSIAGQFTSVDGNNLPILQFENNEGYASSGGLTYWWIGSDTFTIDKTNQQESFIRNLHLWHVFNVSVFHYPASRLTYDGLVIRGKDPTTVHCCSIGFLGGDYDADRIVLRNADIQGLRLGYEPSMVADGLQVLQNSILRNLTNVMLETLGSTNGPNVPARHVVLQNNLFGAWGSAPLVAIHMNWNPGSSGRQDNTTQLDDVRVYAFQRNSSDNFQAYYAEQATQNVAGGTAPCLTTRPEVLGIACPIPSAPPPTTSAPAAPTNVRILPVP